MLNWLQFVSTMILVIITGLYVYLTKRILDTSVQQSRLASNPVVGIQLGAIGMSPVFGADRRGLSPEITLVNVGNAPAIEVLIDAEIIYQYTDIQGEKAIPSRFQPGSIPFIRPGEEVKDEHITPDFGNDCITYLMDDFREHERLNLLRIETEPTRQAYDSAHMKIYVYYRNNLGQFFKSSYETAIYLPKFPKDDETAELIQVYVPRPQFHASPVAEHRIVDDIAKRDGKRHLCGW